LQGIGGLQLDKLTRQSEIVKSVATEPWVHSLQSFAKKFGVNSVTVQRYFECRCHGCGTLSVWTGKREPPTRWMVPIYPKYGTVYLFEVGGGSSIESNLH